MTGDRHGWNSLDHYIGIHDSCLRQFDHFIVDNTVAFKPRASNRLEVSGRITCVGGAYVHVRKILELNQRGQVRTRTYSYHAGIKRQRDQPVFRYDNAHRYDRVCHPDEHHKHLFDETGKEARDPIWIGRDNWPTLREVLEELETWWLQTGQFLPDTESR